VLLSFARLARLARRLSGAATLLLHVGVAVAAPLAEAVVEARSGDAVVHVESESRESCPPAHDHLLCPICRHIEARFVRAASPQRALQQHVLRFGETSALETFALAADHDGALGARAPPHA
jgi:hypothetical protein